MLLLVVARLPGRQGHRHLGHQHPGRLGLRHHQLRLVDRHRPRRHADLGDPAAAAADVADVDQPLRRGDDAVRRRLRRASSRCSTLGRPWLAYWLFPYPNTMGVWPQFRSPLDLGRVRGLDLRDGVAAVLVRRPDPRPGDAARPLAVARRPRHLRHARDGLARLGAALAPLRDGVPAARRPRDAARRLGAHRRQLRLRGRASCPAGTRRSSRRTSSPARSTPASRWC